MAIRERKGPEPPIVRHFLRPGAFVVSTQPGHFTCSATGWRCPGPKAIIDDVSRKVIRYTDIPDPVQIPTHRMSFDERAQEWTEIAFNAQDSVNSHDALQMALDTGIIRIVEDDVVQESFPRAWATRRDKIVYDPRDKNRDAVPLLDLFDSAFEAARAKNKDAQVEASQATQV